MSRDSGHMPSQPVKHCVTLTLPLVDALLDGLATRFAGYSEREDLIIASVTLPVSAQVA